MTDIEKSVADGPLGESGGPSDSSLVGWAPFGVLMVFLLQLLAGASLVIHRLFARFRFYDDEGTLMLWDRHIAEGYALYDEIWNIYGPLPYLLRYFAHEFVGIEISHDNYRLATAVLWLLSASLLSFATFRMSRSIAAAAAVHFLVLLHLDPIANEPGHAQGYVSVLFASVVLAATYVSGKRQRGAMVALGSAAAAMLLTKVNSFAFLALALSGSLVVMLPAGGLAFGLRAAVLAALLALAPALMGERVFSADWGGFAVGYSSAIALIFATLLRAKCRFRDLASKRRGEVELRDTTPGLLAFFLVVGLIVFGIAQLGTSLSALLYSNFVLPLGHADRIRSLFGLRSPGLWSAVSSLAAWFCLYALSRSGAVRGRAEELLLAGLKIAMGILIAAAFLPVKGLADEVQQYNILFGIPLTFLWLVVAPGRAAQIGLAWILPRLVLASSAALQVLYIYPVAGSQRAFGTVLIVVAGMVSLADGLHLLFADRLRVGVGRVLERGASVAACAALVLGTISLAERAREEYRERIPLALPGADYVRLRPAKVALWRWLALNVKQHCDTYVGLPGLNSLYFWADVPAPSRLSDDRWFMIFGADEQRTILSSFTEVARPCGIRNLARFAFWMRLKPGPTVAMPLADHLERDFRTIGSVMNWQFMLPKASSLEEMIYAARLRRNSDGAYIVDLSLPAIGDVPAGRLRIVDPVSGAIVADTAPRTDIAGLWALRVNGASARVFRSGELLDLSEPRRVVLRVDPVATDPAVWVWPKRILVQVYDSSGKLLAPVPFVW